MNKTKAIFVTKIFITIFSTSVFAACTTKMKSYLRAAKGTKSSIIRTLPRYTPLIIEQRDSEWLKVKTHGASGWIYHSLVDETMQCMVIKGASSPKCPSDESLEHELAHNEGLKVLKMEIGCNYVQDLWGRRFWVNSFEAWPPEIKKSLTL